MDLEREFRERGVHPEMAPKASGGAPTAAEAEQAPLPDDYEPKH